MKKITLFTLALFSVLSYAQVGINTNTPDSSSALDIESTTGGILIPRLTETQRDAISSPATGLMIYQTDQTTGFYFYDGTAWARIEGVAGQQGEPGPTGPQGPQGLQGVAGNDGADGTNGVDGSNGSSAYEIWIAAGNTGTEAEFLASLVGAQGETGATGPTGPQGIQGETGATGPTGPQGIQGETGNTGPQGPQGIQGPAGNDGADGTNGTNGVDGADGSSAYQIWITAGNTGTEAEFLASLVGAQGETGPQGPQGIQGESYPQTDQGYVLSGSCTVPGATAYNSDTGQTVVCKPYVVTDGSQQFLITNELACPDNSEGTTTNIEYWISFEVSQPLLVYAFHFGVFTDSSFCGSTSGEELELYKVESNLFSSVNNLGEIIMSNVSGGSFYSPKLILNPGYTYTIRLFGFDSLTTRKTSLSNYSLNNSLFSNIKFYTSSPNSFSLSESFDQWALLSNNGYSFINGNILTVFSDWEFRWESF